MPSVHPDLQALIERRRNDLGLAGEPLSIRAVSRRAIEHGHSLSPETVRRLVNGTHSGVLDDLTVDGLVSALEVSRAEILRAMHETRQQPLGRWEPPDSATRLSLRQRRALESLIAAMVEPNAEDESIELVTAGDQGMVVAKPQHGRDLTAEEIAENEKITGRRLDEMADEDRSAQRFGRG